MVEQFPVGDSLHLLHLGLMKRLLLGWKNGTFIQADTKWRAQTTEAVTEYLLQCKLPAEFRRVMRGLDCLPHWKGTEYRTFLHYVGIVALKDHLTHEVYVHFLLLFCSVTICSSKVYFHMLPVARAMLLQFIEIFEEIYKKHHMTNNVHNLVHIVDEVERFGELESFSAYPFENALGGIKRMLRTGSRPLPQIAKRIMENFNCTMASTDINMKKSEEETPILSKRNDGNNVPADFFKSSLEDEEFAFYSKLQLKQFCLGTDAANCWFLTTKNEIACVTNIIQRSARRDVQLCCIEIIEKNNFFIIPLESRHFNIYCAPGDAHSKEKERKMFGLPDVKCKMVRMPYRESQVFIPLLHTKNAP